MIRSIITQLNKEIPKPQGWRNTTCLAELVSASKEPEIPKQVRNDIPRKRGCYARRPMAWRESCKIGGRVW